MPEKFVLDKILLHPPVTFGKAWMCPAYYNMYFSFTPTIMCIIHRCAL